MVVVETVAVDEDLHLTGDVFVVDRRRQDQPVGAVHAREDRAGVVVERTHGEVFALVVALAGQHVVLAQHDLLDGEAATSKLVEGDVDQVRRVAGRPRTADDGHDAGSVGPIGARFHVSSSPPRGLELGAQREPSVYRSARPGETARARRRRRGRDERGGRRERGERRERRERRQS